MLRYLAALVLVLVVGWILSTSSSFQECTKKQTEAKNEQAKEKSPELSLSITDNAAICVRCAGHIAYEYRDAITAVATVSIALFTLTLWWSTWGMLAVARAQSVDLRSSIAAARIAADAAQASADALPIIEGAYIYPVIAADNIADSLRVFQQSEVITSRLLINYYFKNFGKTPANVLSYQSDLIHPDGQNLRSGDADASQIVRRTTLGSVEHTEPLETEITDFSRAEWAAVQSGSSHLHFTGEIRYADIWGNRWLFSFDWEYSPAQGRFIPDNQTRRKIA